MPLSEPKKDSSDLPGFLICIAIAALLTLWRRTNSNEEALQELQKNVRQLQHEIRQTDALRHHLQEMTEECGIKAK